MTEPRSLLPEKEMTEIREVQQFVHALYTDPQDFDVDAYFAQHPVSEPVQRACRRLYEQWKVGVPPVKSKRFWWA